VHRDSLAILVKQWDWVFNQNGTESPKNQPQIPVGSLAVDSGGVLPTITQGVPLETPEPAAEEPRVLPVHGTAIYPQTETKEGYLVFAKDDRVCVLSYANENWSKGRNESTGAVGLFPRFGYVTLDPPDYATALHDNKYDKTKPDRLVFKINDRILVKGFLNANWDLGYNTRTGEEGRYSYKWVRMDRGRFATALYNYPYDQSKPGHLVFKANDRILVISGDTTDWARGRNESSRQEGKFPGNYVKFTA
jgi:hypothetical protein